MQFVMILEMYVTHMTSNICKSICSNQIFINFITLLKHTSAFRELQVGKLYMNFLKMETIK